MVSTLLSALNAKSVSAVLLAIGVGVACLPRDGIDPEAIEAAASRPAPGCSPQLMGFRFPGPDAYPLLYMPWIRSREDLIAHFTRGEDPDVVRRHVEGPEEELIEYSARSSSRRYPTCRAIPPSEAAPGLAMGTPARVRPRAGRDGRPAG